MKIQEFRELSEQERFTLNYFFGCMDGQVAFAVIGSQTIMMFEGINSSAGEVELKTALNEAVDEVLSNPPDFSTIVMEDGYGIVVVGKAGIVAKLPKKYMKNGRMDMGKAMELRNLALTACENAELIAVAFPD